MSIFETTAIALYVIITFIWLMILEDKLNKTKKELWDALGEKSSSWKTEQLADSSRDQQRWNEAIQDYLEVDLLYPNRKLGVKERVNS